MTDNVTRINPDRPPERHVGFVETESARKMLLSLRSARAARSITMIIAASGIGKTRTKFHFRHMEAPRSIILDIGPDQSGQWGLACALCLRLGLEEPNARNLSLARTKIAERLGPDGFLMLDEAQNLIKDGEGRGKDDYRAFEWIRMAQEEGEFGLAFLGDKSLERVLSKYPQIKRRTHPRVDIRSVSAADVTAFCSAHGLTDPKAVQKLYTVVGGHDQGGLGALQKIKEDAWDMADGHTPSPQNWLSALSLFERGIN